MAGRFVSNPQATKPCRGYLAQKQSTQVEFWWMPQSNTGMPLSLPEGWAALLWAARILTVSQRDWPESRMYLIPAAADSTAVDSIKSGSCFLTRIRAWLGSYQKRKCLLIRSLRGGFNPWLLQTASDLPEGETWEQSSSEPVFRCS